MDRYDYQALVNEVVTRGINMFENFDDWTKGAFALSNLGEDGAPFHSLYRPTSPSFRKKCRRSVADMLYSRRKAKYMLFGEPRPLRRATSAGVMSV